MNKERILKVLVEPHVSEKSTRTADEHRQFVFRVAPDATKPEIKRAVEELFQVKVASVQVLNLKGKRKRFGLIQGRRPGVRKAYVRLEPGHDIDFGPAQ